MFWRRNNKKFSPQVQANKTYRILILVGQLENYGFDRHESYD